MGYCYTDLHLNTLFQCVGSHCTRPCSLSLINHLSLLTHMSFQFPYVTLLLLLIPGVGIVHLLLMSQY
jgi:hypothetical protein